MKDKALFIINSPFQGICMLEAISYFNIADYDVILREDVIEKNNVMLEQLLNEQNVLYRRMRMNHIVNDVKSVAFKYYNHYSKIFIGDYFSGGVCAYSLALFWAKPQAQIIYLDDGAQTYRVFSKPPYPRYKNLQIKCMVGAYSFLNLYKFIDRRNFFSIFNIVSLDYKVYHNDLSLLKSKMQTADKSGIYIIGTNSSALSLNEDYLILLNRTINRLKQESKEIYYCPHRRDKNHSKVVDFLMENGVKVFDTEVSVEYDFIKNMIYPKHIIGFGSSALFSLKAIFPDAIVENVRFQLTNAAHQKRYENIYLKMVDSGITNIIV